MDKCADCRFAKAIRMPGPLPAPAKVKILWGLISYIEEDEMAAAIHDYETKDALNRIICARYPATVTKPKTSSCGEFRAPAAPAQEAK